MRWVVGPLCALLTAVALCAFVASCAGPVWATRCAIVSGPGGRPALRATLTNLSHYHVKSVGVLTGGNEFEFSVRIAPLAGARDVLGTPFDPELIPAQARRGAVGNWDCFARMVEFTDGEPWSTSPL